MMIWHKSPKHIFAYIIFEWSLATNLSRIKNCEWQRLLQAVVYLDNFVSQKTSHVVLVSLIFLADSLTLCSSMVKGVEFHSDSGEIQFLHPNEPSNGSFWLQIRQLRSEPSKIRDIFTFLLCKYQWNKKCFWKKVVHVI